MRICMILLLVSSTFLFADTIKFQGFEGTANDDWNYSNDVAFFDNGWGDDGYYGIIHIEEAAPIDYASLADSILGENDLDDEGDNGTTDFATTQFEEVDISAYSNVSLSFDWDVEGYNASDDDAKYELFYNGVSQGEVFLLDGGVDPEDGEGTETINIPDTVNTLALHIMVRDNGATGYSGFDNFTVEGVAGNNTVVFFAESEATVNEGDGTYDLVVSISNPDDNNATTADVVLISGDPSDVGNYTAQSVTFPAGSSQDQTVTVDITDDNEVEGDEALTFELQNVSGGNNAAAGTPSQFDLTIEDNDLPTIVINEIMKDPVAVVDTAGEWFELYNPGDSEVDINGWTIKDDDFDSHVIDNGGPLIIASDGYLVLGRNSDSLANGGVEVDYVYDGILLANSDDEVVMVYSDGASEVDRVVYNESDFPDESGKSMELTNPDSDNNDGVNWASATVAYGDGDFGTPGSVNSTIVSTVDRKTGVLIRDYHLYPNYPNPFNPRTTIRFSVPQFSQDVQLSIYNVEGKRVRTLFAGALNAGLHKHQWDGRDANGTLLASGVYYAILEAGAFRSTIKMMFIK